MTLSEYLHGLTGQKRIAGKHDCCTFPANWAIACGRPDPMKQWRGAYATDVEAEEIVADAGGLAGLFEMGMTAAGIPPVDGDPQEGDIAVITLLGEEAGAIFTGKRWAFVPERGLGFVSLDREHVACIWRP